MSIYSTKFCKRALLRVSLTFAAVWYSLQLTAQIPVEPPGAAAEPTFKTPDGVQPIDSLLSLDQFRPEPRLHVNQTRLPAARFPVVDAHTHMYGRTRHDATLLKQIVQGMDADNIAVLVSLDGTLGERLHQHIKYLWTDYKERFVIFANIDFKGEGTQENPASWACNQPGFVQHTCEQLRDAQLQGISGVKFFKQFGLGYLNPDGSLVEIDDPRWDPIWKTCGELGLPIIMHTADPSAFFQPIDATNERAEELLRHPTWSFYGEQFPSRDALHAARNRVIAKFPDTHFIAAHFGNDAEDLTQTAQWLDEYRNLTVEFGSRISELGRQPYTAREFFLKYQDRIMFGTDGPWPQQRIESYWRFLETKDEYFDYSEKEPPPQGIWRIYGIYLPDEVLEKIYFKNAAKFIPGIAERLQDRHIKTGVPRFSTR